MDGLTEKQLKYFAGMLHSLRKELLELLDISAEAGELLLKFQRY